MSSILASMLSTGKIWLKIAPPNIIFFTDRRGGPVLALTLAKHTSTQSLCWPWYLHPSHLALCCIIWIIQTLLEDPDQTQPAEGHLGQPQLSAHTRAWCAVGLRAAPVNGSEVRHKTAHCHTAGSDASYGEMCQGGNRELSFQFCS